MKILHTADWHIGKILYKHELKDEFNLFFTWFIDLIRQENIDVVMISGDIFDIANPSVAERKTYYEVLNQLQQTGAQIIVTGGNHDSIGLLDAPKDILSNFNIHVIGGACENISEELIEIKNAQGEVSLIIAAVPFLRDKDLRNLYDTEEYENRAEAIRVGIRKHYQKLAELSTKKYPDIPSISMGHLFAKGVISSDSERDIHVGNSVAVGKDTFPSDFIYVALGHIHRPQRVDKCDHIRYSGSPIALSFSEKEDIKQVVIIEINENKLGTIQPVEVPKTRELRKISGTLVEVKEALDQYKPSFPLMSFVEVEVQEDKFNTKILSDTEELALQYGQQANYKILKNRTLFKETAHQASDLFETGSRVEDLSPKDVFEKKLASEELSPEEEKMYLETFQQLLEELMQS